MSGSGGGRKLIPSRPLPANLNPTGTRCITVKIPDDDEWERNLYSVIFDGLAQWLCWERDGGKNGTRVARLWKRALRTWSRCPTEVPTSEIEEFVSMPEFRTVCDSGQSFLEWKTCTCPETWERLAMVAQLGTGGQPGPGGGGTPPPGGSQQTCAKLLANQQLLLPTLVNSGDTLRLVSSDGAGWDGGEDDFGPLWRVLANGDQYVGGIDTGGFTRVTGTDPAVAANHMTIIAAIGPAPVYLALPLNTDAIVPGGVTNGQVAIQVNDSDISNNQGSSNICVKVTNNAAPTWTHVFDFTASNQGWSKIPSTGGNWSLGSGWIMEAGSFPPQVLGEVYAHIVFPARPITALQIEFSLGNASEADEGAMQCFLSGSSVVNLLLSNSQCGSAGPTAATTFAPTMLDELWLSLQSGYSGLCVADHATVSKVTVSGNGTDPF